MGEDCRDPCTENLILDIKKMNVKLQQLTGPPELTTPEISQRTGPLRRHTTRVIHRAGHEGGFVESKTMTCQTNMAKGAWGRQYGDILKVFLRAGNKRGGLRIYHNYRRHLLKSIVTSPAGRTPSLATAKRLYQRRHKKKYPNFCKLLVIGTWGGQLSFVGATGTSYSSNINKWCIIWFWRFRCCELALNNPPFRGNRQP